ncbi:MAG: 2-phosphosulfolactate phosphatase [Solirubrobacteraceae bacterium]|jgi:2-phosphosulfolactate phosphatase|nr:2-phosphosulfolactate phosphatase [Solirubrobacteraceae bacterium]
MPRACGPLSSAATGSRPTIDVAFLGAQARPAATAVVIDVLRATSTITLALTSGYERVLVAGSIERALELDGEGRVLAGERECEKPPGFALGNSPEDTLTPRGPELVLTTTNGAPAIVAAAAVSDEVIVGCLLNLDAVVATLAASAGDVLLVCAGTNGKVTLEDVYLAGRISAALEGERTDAARIAEALAAAYAQPIDALEASSGAVGIHAAGLSSDIDFCAQESITAVVPRLARMLDDIAVLEPGEPVGHTGQTHSEKAM